MQIYFTALFDHIYYWYQEFCPCVYIIYNPNSGNSQ